jgi:hypothetical protein
VPVPAAAAAGHADGETRAAGNVRTRCSSGTVQSNEGRVAVVEPVQEHPAGRTLRRATPATHWPAPGD